MNATELVIAEPDTMSWFRDENGPRDPFMPKPGTTAKPIAIAIREADLYVVIGRGDFPVDMLRYDRGFVCTPIPHPRHPNYRKALSVVIGICKPYEPTAARWNSFGWRVKPVPLEDSEALKDRAGTWRGVCQRCGCTECGQAYTMSYFNRDLICSRCDEAERQHPDFNLAEASGRFAISQGDYTFPGIGWPGIDGRST